MDELISYFKNINIHIGDIIFNNYNEYFEVSGFKESPQHDKIILCKCIYGARLGGIYTANKYNFTDFSMKKATKEQINYINKLMVFQ